MSEPRTDGETRGTRLAVIGIVVVAALLRFAALGAFPEVQADEGLWTVSAKNALLYGNWFMDGQTHLFLSPLFEGVLIPVFWVFGAAIRNARYVSAAAGTVSVALTYVLARRTTRDPWLAVGAAAVLATDQVAVVLGRSALIESVQLAWLLATAALLTSPSASVRRYVAPLAFAAAIATKISSLFMAPILAAWLLTDWALHRPRRFSELLADAVVFAVVAGVVCAAVYGALYAWQPAQFVAAFRFELDGVHFQSISNPIVRFGRFGIDPSQIARTVLDLLRESPFLLVLASLGALWAVVHRERSLALWMIWGGFGVAFFLAQMYQPARYFYLCWPCFVVAAAYFLRRAAAGAAPQTWGVLVAAVVAFNLAYVGSNFAANRGTMLAAVRSWAVARTAPSDRLMAAAYLATDVPRRVYARYRLATSPDQLLASIDSLHIRYVIADRYEWPPLLLATLDARYPVVTRWPFGAVYGTAAPPR